MKEVKIPKGYKLKLVKSLSCPICQRPELRGEWDKIIWSRQFSIPHIMTKIKEKLDLEFSPREIRIHRTHLKLVRSDDKIEAKEKKKLIDEFIAREGKLIGIDAKRKRIKLNPTNQIDSRIKALSAQLVELEMNGFYNDPLYLAKIREWKNLMEMKLRKEGEMKEEVEVSIAVKEVDEIFKRYRKMKEREKKNAARNKIRKKNEGNKLENK